MKDPGKSKHFGGGEEIGSLKFLRAEACRLQCGTVAPLTFEHIPPRCTWNKQKIVHRNLLELLKERRPWDAPPDGKGHQSQRGLGGYCFCGTCNNFLNEKYVPAYREFAYQAVRSPLEAPSADLDFFPLRVLKQVVSMFCALNDGGPRWEEVVRFVRDPSRQALPDDYRVFVFRCEGAVGRLCGWQVVGNIYSGSVTHISEVATRPLGFQMRFGDAHASAKQLLDITEWARFGPEERAEATVEFGLLPVFSPMFNDFRTPDEMRATRQRNEGAGGN